MLAVQPVTDNLFSVAPDFGVTQGVARDNMMTRILLLAAMIGCLAVPAGAETVAKSYRYFSVGGTTYEQIERELSKRGPHVKSTGMRHAGATRMNFTTKIGYASNSRGCSVVSAATVVKANVILPKWRHRSRADADMRLFWDTLFADIKRHEERHVGIAKAHARELEQALRKTGRFRTCEAAAANAKEISAKILARHDRAQLEFDRVEAINFESRLLSLLRHRMERVAAARRSG